MPQFWSDDKRTRCCINYGLGCAVADAPAPGGSDAYDCLAGLDNCVTGWSPGKKAWCLAHSQYSCKLTTVSPAPFDCKAGANNWQAGWSKAKQDYCCQQHPHICEVYVYSQKFEKTGKSRGSAALLFARLRALALPACICAGVLAMLVLIRSYKTDSYSSFRCLTMNPQDAGVSRPTLRQSMVEEEEDGPRGYRPGGLSWSSSLEPAGAYAPVSPVANS